MINYLKRFTPLSAMLVFPLLGMIYAAVNGPSEHIYSLVTDLDRAIPMVKGFVLPYSIWIFYIYACVVYFFLKDPKVFYRSIIMYTVCALLCYMIYAVFQTTVPRPALIGDDPFNRLLSFVYDRDQPFNCFPSIHCFSSYMVMKLLANSSFRNRLNMTLIYGMSSIIIASTLFVKQHVIMDALAGFLLVEIVHWALTLLERAARPSIATPEGYRNKSL